MKKLPGSQASQHFFGRLFSDYRTWLLAAAASLTLILGFAASVSYTHVQAAQDSFTGQWLMEYRAGDDGAHMTFRYEYERKGRGYNSNTSFEVTPAQLQGLTREQAISGGSHVQFQFKRDAGTFNCEG